MEARRTSESTTALAEITRAIAVSLDAATVFGVVEQYAPAILRHDSLWILLRSTSSSGEDEWTIAFHGSRHPFPGQVFILSDVSFGPTLLANLPIIIADFAAAADTARLDRLLLDNGGRSAVAVPIRVASRVLGGLLLICAEPQAYTTEDAVLLEPLAGLLALALEHERLDRQASTLAVVEERNRLAREIHDTLAQSLTAMILNLEALKPYAQGRRAAEAALLAETEALARGALVEARRSVLGLHPSPLVHQTLNQAIAQELAAFQRRTGTATQFYVDGTRHTLGPDQAAALFRITQEALQNIAKHGQAQTVVVGLTFTENEVTLSIEDDGVGFDPRARGDPNLHGGSGLDSMTGRARSLGGTLTVASHPGHGTRLDATLPHRGPLIQALVRPATDPPPATHPTRLLIVDDHPVTRQGLHRILDGQADLRVVGEAADGLAAVEQVRALQPDVVLLDLQMPRLGGLAAIPLLRAAQPQIEVVVLTTFDQDEHVFAALKAGARGYILKDASSDTLLATIRAAARGESLLPTALTTRVVEGFVALAQRDVDPDALNPRELEVLRLMAHGRPYKEIGVELHIATKTVQYHVGNILGKLHVRSRGAAVAVALERGLLG